MTTATAGLTPPSPASRIRGIEHMTPELHTVTGRNRPGGRRRRYSFTPAQKLAQHTAYDTTCGIVEEAAYLPGGGGR